jgi:hypothetical protein
MWLAALNFVVFDSLAHLLGFHQQMLFFVAPYDYIHLLIRFVGVWACTQVSATLSHPIWGHYLLFLMYRYEFGFINQGLSSESQVQVVVGNARVVSCEEIIQKCSPIHIHHSFWILHRSLEHYLCRDNSDLEIQFWEHFESLTQD